MQPEKPYLFIGSSQEARQEKVVATFMDILSEEAHCIPWWLDPRFKEEGSNTTFDALCAAATEYDFAVFILTADDKLESRDKTFVAPRDNVVFEFGLFLGTIGPARVMGYVRRPGDNLKIPSDFSGVGMPSFEFDGSPKATASIQSACSGFCANIRKLSFRKIDLILTREWTFDSDAREFFVNLCPARITRVRSTIGNFRVCIAARVLDSSKNIEDDENIVYSSIRKLPETVNDDIPFRIAESQFKRTLSAGDTIQARVLLIPDTLVFDPNKTLSVAIKARCREVETLSFKLGTPVDGNSRVRGGSGGHHGGSRGGSRMGIGRFGSQGRRAPPKR